MLPITFFGQNLNFALNLFFGLALFATFWLYFDAWTVNKKASHVFKWLSFLLLAISFLLSSVVLDQNLINNSIFSSWFQIASILVRNLGLAILLFALIREPIQARPITSGLENFKAISPLLLPFVVLNPVLALAVALLYFRRSTDGLEKHLKLPALAFLALGAYEIMGLFSLLRETSHIFLSTLVASFGPLWWMQQIFLLLATIILGRWVYSYLVKRVETQLFIVFSSFVVMIFLITAISFSFLLFRNVQTNALDNLEVASKVLNLTLDSKKAELRSIAEVYATNIEVSSAITSKNHNQLSILLKDSLTDKSVSSIIIANKDGLVLIRAEDPSSWGDSISNDPIQKKVVSSGSLSTTTTKDSGVNKIVLLQAAEPIVQDNQTIGSVMVGLEISNSFLDGIKTSTGLDSAVYADNTRAATTLLAPDKKSRWVGIKEENSQIKNSVLDQGKTYSDSTSLANRAYLVVYEPLRGLDNKVIGMIFTGQPESSVLETAADSIELIFIVSVVLLVLSLIPAYLVSRYIEYQLA